MVRFVQIRTCFFYNSLYLWYRHLNMNYFIFTMNLTLFWYESFKTIHVFRLIIFFSELKASSPVKVPTPPPPSSFSFQTKPSSPTKSTGSSHQSQYSATQYNQLESIIHSQSQYTSQHSQSQATKQHSQTSQFSQTKPAPPGAILEKNGARIHHSRSSSSIDDGYLAGNVGKVEASFDARTAAPALPGLSKMGPNVDLDLQVKQLLIELNSCCHFSRKNFFNQNITCNICIL